MDLYTLLDNLVTAVAQDATLKAWSQLYYGQDHYVFVDQDERDPPGESDAPCVQFHSPSKSADEENRIVEYGVGVFALISDNTLETGGEDNVEEYTSTGRLVYFANRIITVIRAAKPDDFVMAYGLITDTITGFPNFEADIAVDFRERLVIGDDPLG